MRAAVPEMHRLPGGMVSLRVKGLKSATVASLLVSSVALATTAQLTADLKSPKKLRLTAVVQGFSTLHKTEQQGRVSFGRIMFAPSYPLNDDYRGTLTGALIQNFDQESKTGLSNFKLTVSRKPIALTQDTSLIAIGGLRLPTNEDDRRDNTFNGALVLEPQVLSQFNVRGFKFMAISGLTAVKNFHTYSRNNLGSANISYSVAPSLGFETYLMKNVALGVDGSYTFARTYQDTPRTSFALGQALTYEQPLWSVTIGHYNEADALKYNGTESNINVFDGNTSAVYGQVRVVY